MELAVQVVLAAAVMAIDNALSLATELLELLTQAVAVVVVTTPLVVQEQVLRVVQVLLLLDTQWYKGEKICHIGQK
jgi:hypothetical protein